MRFRFGEFPVGAAMAILRVDARKAAICRAERDGNEREHALSSMVNAPASEAAAALASDHPRLSVGVQTERDFELRTILDPRLPAILDELGIELVGFADLSRLGWQPSGATA